MLTYGELPESPAYNVALYCCAGCDEGYSATRGDYFMRDAGEIIVCAECGSTMFLGRRVTTVENV